MADPSFSYCSGTASDVANRSVHLDTFLYPLVQDLRTLAIDGILTHRWSGDELVSFRMRGHLLLVTGDMPAISKVSHEPIHSDPFADLQHHIL
jgi:hypothetical protein